MVVMMWAWWQSLSSNDTAVGWSGRNLPHCSNGLCEPMAMEGLSEFRCNRVWVGHWLLGIVGLRT